MISYVKNVVYINLIKYSHYYIYYKIKKDILLFEK